MPLQNVFPFKDMFKRVTNMLVRKQDSLLLGLLASTEDDELVHVVDGTAAADKLRVFRALPADRRGRILDKISDHSRDSVLPLLTSEELRAIIDAMESDDAVDIIQFMSEAQRSKVIADLRKSDPKELLPLLVFGPETAGGLMKTEIMRLRSSLTVDEARRALSGVAASKSKSHHIYVNDDKEVLLGTLAPMRLLQSAPDARIADLMTVTFPSVPPTMDQEEVAKEFDEHNAIEIPVIGPKGKVLGVITADDIFEVMEKEYAEDISRLVGVDEDDRITDPVMLTVRRRLPWLVVNLGTAVLAASVVSLFQGTIQRVVILAAYMPIVAGMGGNASTQTLGVVVRAIALGELHHLSTAAAVAKQIAVGTLNGVAVGILMGGIAYAWTHDIRLALVILVSMTVNLFVAGFGGVMVPVVMKRLRIDPALASTVFVTTLTDCCGFFVFLGLASVFM